MKCPKCNNDDQIDELGSEITLMGFSSFWSAGVRHSHDPNEITTGFKCSCGEIWKNVTYNHCPAPNCDYNRK